MTRQHDFQEIREALSVLVEPGTTFEIRILHQHRKRVDAGYFDNIDAAATAVSELEEHYQGIYYTPNPVQPDLLARSANRISAWSAHTTLDPEILRRRWLLIDVDPKRASGISSTEGELNEAFKAAKSIANGLELYGWPRPIIAASGNGCHVMYRIDEPNNEAVRDTISTFLQCLNATYCSLSPCEVDRTVFNAARIWRLTGTWARKGDNVPTRPHRKSYFVDRPEFLATVKFAQIQAFVEANLSKLGALKRTPAQGGVSKSRLEYPDDERKYRHINDAAYNRLQEWVPKYFPTARPYKEGYRVSSEDLGLDFEEDLTIHPKPMGIKYFGVADQGDGTEGRRTPVSLMAEFAALGSKELAARQLADTLKLPISEFSDLAGGGGNFSVDTSSAASVIQGPQAGRANHDFTKIPSIAQLRHKTFKNQTWLIDDVLPAGNILLASRPKMRKTFLALQLGIAVCTGGKFMNWNVAKGDVLFLGLEDNERRLRSRINLLTTFHLIPPDLSGFRYWCGGVDLSPTGKSVIVDPAEHARTYEMFPRGEAGVDALKAYLKVYPNTKLIVIDTYAHFREQSNNRDVYQRDYDQMMPITRFASEAEITILTVHHEKKGLAGNASGDFMEDISGTTGITGAVDGVMSIKGKRGPTQENEQRQLMLSGRDIVNDLCIDMNFQAERGGWLPAAKENVREAILGLLKSHILTETDIKYALDHVNPGTIRQILSNLKMEGLVKFGKEGYRRADLY